MSYPTRLTDQVRRNYLVDAVERALVAMERARLEVSANELADHLHAQGVHWTPKLVRVEMDGWAALYEDDVLYDNVGDSYLADERLSAWLDVEEKPEAYYDALRSAGRVSRDTIPKALGDFDKLISAHNERRRAAERLRAEAQALINQADELEGKA